MRILTTLFVLLWVCLLPLHAQQVEQADSLLSNRMDGLVDRMLPRGSNVGALFVDLATGRTIYDYQSDMLSRPASTMKLVTAVTALSGRGAGKAFRTEVWYTGRIERDTLHGDLYVVGGFDPEFTEDDLQMLTDSVCRLPFSVLSGRVYGDVSAKDSLYWGSGWLWDDNPSAFQPYLSPLMLEKGTVRVLALPGKRAGEPATVMCTPESGYCRIVNRTRTNTRSAGPFRVTRDWMHNSNDILVSGNVSATQARVINVFAPERLFMQAFVERLRQGGLRCDTAYAFAELRRDTAEAVLVAAHETGEQAVLGQMLKESDNLNAEAMLWRTGAQAAGHRRVTAKDGLKETRRLIERLGLSPADYRLADGCGLSHYDYLSPRLLVELLRYAYSRTEVFQKLYKALPVSGVDGTLKYRMGYGTPGFRNVFAKTGSYTGVSSLAGYLKTRSGRWVAFAIMNQNSLSGRQARALQDELCMEVITGW